MSTGFNIQGIAPFRNAGKSTEVPESMFRSVALWDVTKKCDLHCIHCYNYDKYMADVHSAGQETTTEQAMGIIDRLADFGFEQIHFLGGEPLNRDDCIQLFAHAASKGLIVSINSNGIRLTGEMMERLIDAGVAQIGVSIDGSDPESNDHIRGHGTFKRITANLETAVKVKTQRGSTINLASIVTLNRPLLEKPGKVGAFFPLMDSLGVTWINFIFLYKNSKALTNANELAYPMSMALHALETEAVPNMRQYPRIHVQLDCRPLFGKYLNRKYGVRTVIYQWAIRCSAGNRTWLVDADGQVHPCGLCSTPDYGLPAAEAGCFVYSPLNMKLVNNRDEVYESEYFRTVRKYLRAKSSYDKFTTCKGCEFFGPTCLPCPLYSPDGAAYNMETCTVEECEWEKAKLEEFYSQQEAAVPELCFTDLELRQDSDRLYVRVPALDLSFSLVGSAMKIWPWIDGKTSVATMVDRLAHSYMNAPGRPELRRDIVDFLCHLRDGKVLSMKGAN